MKVSSASTAAAFGAEGRQRAVGHGLADAVHEEPSGLHGAAEAPLDLPRRDTLLADADQMDHLQPQVQRRCDVFEDGPIATVKGFWQA